MAGAGVRRRNKCRKWRWVGWMGPALLGSLSSDLGIPAALSHPRMHTHVRMHVRKHTFSLSLQTPGPGALSGAMSMVDRLSHPPHGGLPPATSRGSYQQDQDHGALVDVVSVYSRTFTKPAPRRPQKERDERD